MAWTSAQSFGFIELQLATFVSVSFLVTRRNQRGANKQRSGEADGTYILSVNYASGFTSLTSFQSTLKQDETNPGKHATLSANLQKTPM